MHAIVLAACCLIFGHVHDAAGAPIASATAVLEGAAPQRLTTDARGAFSASAAPGDYRLSVGARGFLPASIDLKLDHDTTIDVALESVDAPSLRTIASVTVDGRLAPQRGTIPSIAVSRADFERLGQDLVVQGLAQIPSVTFSHPDGGASSAISVVSLRGPDPSETLIALDGQLLNDANTGDVDLSRFPVAAFTAVDVTEGLGPQDSEGSNTIGGAVDLVSLRPTKAPHTALSTAVGSFGYSEQWANATGSHGRLGYAFAADNQHERGYVNEVQNVYALGADPATATPQPLPLGSALAAQSALANLTWTFSQNAALNARVFTLANTRDQSSAINGIDGNPSSPTYGLFIGPGEQTLVQNIRAYQLRGRAPLGAGELSAELSADDDAIDVAGAMQSPYDAIHRDERQNVSLAWQRTFDNAQFALGGYARNEAFTFVYPGNQPQLDQTIFNGFLRASRQVTQELELQAAAYEAHYTTFGSNLDWRFGAVLNASPATAYRFSVGTGFRAPLLIERYVFPVGALTQDANGVYLGQGNPSERPEHATEYELGVSHRYSADTTLDVSLYRTNLRDPIENYYPLGAVANGTCTGASNTPPLMNPVCFSFPINVGNVVYEGAEVRFAQRFARQHLFMNARYGLNVAYPLNLGSTISNPTSGGNLVNDEQFLGIPQQQGSLEFDWENAPMHAAIAAVFRGNNNELHQGPFTIFNAAVGARIGRSLDVTLAGTNLFSDAAGRYTVFGGGVPYRGVVAQDPSTGAPIYGPLPTDRLGLEPFALNFVVTIRQ